MRFILDERKSRRGYSIKLYAERDGKRVTVSTGVFVKHRSDFLGGELMETDVNYLYNNIRLRGIGERLEDTLKFTDDLKAACVAAIKGGSVADYRTEVKVKGFIPVFKEFIKQKKKTGTRVCYEQTLKKVAAYDKSVTFEKMTPEWLTRFDEELSKKMSVNGKAIVLRNIRAVWNYALDMGMTKAQYPFKRSSAVGSSRFGIKHEQTRKRNVPLDLLRRLKDYPVEPFQEPYRDMFMLMVYLVGIDIVDILHLKKTDLADGYITYVRQKTDKENATERRFVRVKVEPEAMELIERLKGKDWLLYPLDNYANYNDYTKRMNKALKTIGMEHRSGRRITGEPLIEGLTTKWSRHTWATLAAELDYGEDLIGRALGHSQSSARNVTKTYINYDQKKIDAANRSVIDYINKTESKDENKGCLVVSMLAI